MKKLNKTSNETKTMEKLKALNQVTAGTGIPEDEAGPSNCTCICSGFCGDCGNDAAMYTGNKAYY